MPPPPSSDAVQSEATQASFAANEVHQLATALDIESAVLAKTASEATDCYHRFPLSKGNGRKRWIEAPSPELKFIQKRLLEKVLYQRPPHPAAHGFVPNRSIVTNARPHIGRKWVANFDIKDFFPSTKAGTVLTILEQYSGHSPTEHTAMLHLVCRNGCLPQGAPTSPHLANLAMWNADVALWRYSNQHNITYTRYADDLTFSGDVLPDSLFDFLKQVLADNQYRLAPGKSKWLGQHKRQMVTGLVVNEKLNLPRPIRKRLRAIVHDIKTNGIEQALERSTMNLNQIVGRIAFQAMWDRETAREQILELADAIGL